MSTSIVTNHQIFEDDHPKYTPHQGENHDATDQVNIEPSLFNKLRSIISVSEILRLFGACAVIASMSLFLLNGWAEGNDIQRYLKLLAQTGLLTLGGFAMSYALKENKGARLFFALALISVVANFTILGSLIYSMIQLDGGLIDYPSMVTWTVASASSFLPVFIGAVIALMVLARFSFSIFARKIATPLTASFLLVNTLLLVPVRTSLFISLLAVIGIVFASAVVKKLSIDEKVVFTKETKFAMSLLFAPALLIIARAVGLYSVDEVLLVLLSGLAYAFLRFSVAKVSASPIARSLVEIAQFCVGVVLSISVVNLFPRSVESIHVLIFSIVAVAITFDQMQATQSSKWKKTILSITTVVVVGLNVLIAAIENDLLIQLFSVLICAGLFYLATRNETPEQPYRLSKLISILGTFLSIGILLMHLVNLINLGNWVLIGLLGVSLIVLGSLYERFGLSLASIVKPKL